MQEIWGMVQGRIFAVYSISRSPLAPTSSYSLSQFLPKASVVSPKASVVSPKIPHIDNGVYIFLNSLWLASTTSQLVRAVVKLLDWKPVKNSRYKISYKSPGLPWPPSFCHQGKALPRCRKQSARPLAYLGRSPGNIFRTLYLKTTDEHAQPRHHLMGYPYHRA